MKPSPQPIRKTFAENVKNYRNALQYSQEKLAEKSGLSVQTVKDIEGGRRWASDNTLTRLAQALNIAEFQLLLPEKHDSGRKLRKPPLKNLMSLKQKLKQTIDEQFEEAANTGDFS